MTDKQLQPLQDRIKIVNDDGTPTQYFIRWAQQKQIDIKNSVTPAQVDQAIADWAFARDIIAGVGLNGGGNLGADITIDADIQELLNLISTTRGSVLYRGAASWAALAPGTAGQVLSTNGAGADPSWIAAGGGGGSGGWTLITDTILAANAANVSFSSIPNTYKDLKIEYESRQNTGGDVEFYVQFNGDTAANYQSYIENRFGNANNAAATSSRCGNSASSATTANVFAFGEFTVYGYSSATRFKHLKGTGFYPSGAFEDRQSGVWRNSAAAISSLILFPASNQFATGSRFRLYGGMT